jgi:glutamine synthetase
MTGRTLYGALPPRNQNLNEHYYGKMSDKIYEIFNEAENKLLKLGVPVKTKHKEVAVNQF